MTLHGRSRRPADAVPERPFASVELWRDVQVEMLPDVWAELACGHYDVMQAGVRARREDQIPHFARFEIVGPDGDVAALPPEELPPLTDAVAHETALREYLVRACVLLDEAMPATVAACRAAFVTPPRP